MKDDTTGAVGGQGPTATLLSRGGNESVRTPTSGPGPREKSNLVRHCRNLFHKTVVVLGGLGRRLRSKGESVVGKSVGVTGILKIRLSRVVEGPSVKRSNNVEKNSRATCVLTCWSEKKGASMMSKEPRTPSPGSKAGQDADDEEHQLTDEERMLEEIAKEKELIDALPSDTTSACARRASREKKLGQLEFKYQFSVEKIRLARALSKFEERHGVIYSEPCLICLEDIHIHASESLIQVFACCGGFVCMTCANSPDLSALVLGKCPLCREPLVGKTEAEGNAQRMKLAKRGVAWAQAELGTCMIEELKGFKKQKKSGLEWLNKAVAQDHPSAVYNLSKKYLKGFSSVLRKSQDKANELLLKSANLGYAVANAELAGAYYSGTNGFEKDPDEAYFRASVAYALDASNKLAAMMLGLYLKLGQATEPSPYLTCYYLNIAANEDKDGLSCYLYSQALWKLTPKLYNLGIVPGHNVAPTWFFWIRKSSDLGYNDARKQLTELEIIMQSKCGNCGKEVQAGEKFKSCFKCKAQWYCSKECQVEAWKAGHKKDCKRASILKFEDYLYAE